VDVTDTRQEAKLQALLADMQAVKLGFDRGFMPLLSAVQFARLVVVTPYLCDVNALGIAVGASRTQALQNPSPNPKPSSSLWPSPRP